MEHNGPCPVRDKERNFHHHDELAAWDQCVYELRLLETVLMPTFDKIMGGDKTELPDLVTSDSWQMFDILKLSPDWLALPPDEWDTDPDYIVFRNFVRTVKVTNDCAERGVKLATDYSKSLTKDSQERSKIYQVVEAERRAKPDTKKSTRNK